MDASDWMKGVFFSVVASVIGAASKLAIRKSWLLEEEHEAAAEATFLAQAEAVDSADEEEGYDVDSRGPSSPQHQLQLQLNDSNTSRTCEPLPEDKPGESSDGTQSAAKPQQQQPLPPNRRRGKSIYTAVAPSSPGAAAAAAEESATEYPEIESSPSSSSSVTRRRNCCCTLPRFLRYGGMMGMTFINPAFCLLAMNYASPSILAPFSGLTLVWVIVLSRPLIGESPTLSQKVASSLIVLGEVMVAIFGDHTNDDDAGIASVEASYRELPFILYFVAVALWMLLMGVWIANPRSSQTLKRFAWGASGGSMTGVAQCFIKDSLVVLKATPGLTFFQKPWYLPLFIFLSMAFSFSGLLFLTATMKRYDATYSAAMFVGSFVVCASIMSVAHYHTFDHLAELMDIVMYPIGLITLMVGVYILVQRGTQTTSLSSSTDSGNEEPDDDDDADRITYMEGDRWYEPPEHSMDDDAIPDALMMPSEIGGGSSKMLSESDTTLTTSTRSSTTTITDRQADDIDLIC